MKHWRFFPILVKLEVLKNLNLSDKLSFSECSKKCWNLVSRIPSHVKNFKLPDHTSYSVLVTSRKSTIQNLNVTIWNPEHKALADQFFETLLSEKRNSIKVKELTMNITPEYSEMYKKFIDFCDPNFIESIEIEGLDSQEVYEDIPKTPQWKNSRQVSLNYGSWLRPFEINIDDFLHFKSIKLNMLELSVEDAFKLVQKAFTNESEADYTISFRNLLEVTLIRQKIDTELVGNWVDAGNAMYPARKTILSGKPHLAISYEWRMSVFYVKVRPV